MPLLPFAEFAIDSPLPPGRAAAELARKVEPRRLTRSTRATAVFEGEVTETRVDIRRTTDFRHAFLPDIVGSFERTPHGSRLRGTMQLHPLDAIFIFLWMAFVLVACVASAREYLRTRNGDPTAFYLVGMLVAGWAIPTAGFTIEAGIARSALAAILARETPSALNSA